MTVYTMCIGMDGRWYHHSAAHPAVRVLPWTVPGCHIHHQHASRKSVLCRQSHRSLLPHLPHLVPRILSTGRIWRQGQSRDNHTVGTGRLSPNGRRNNATDPRCHSNSRYYTRVFQLYKCVVSLLTYLHPDWQADCTYLLTFVTKTNSNSLISI